MWEKYELCLLEKKLKLAFLTNSGHHSIGRGEMGVYRWGTAKAEPRETLNTGGRCHSSLGPWAVLTLCGQSCTEAHTAPAFWLRTGWGTSRCSPRGSSACLGGGQRCCGFYFDSPGRKLKAEDAGPAGSAAQRCRVVILRQIQWTGWGQPPFCWFHPVFRATQVCSPYRGLGW